MHGVAAPCAHASANDNGGAEARIDSDVVTPARRIAREEPHRPDADNDNAPEKDAGEN